MSEYTEADRDFICDALVRRGRSLAAEMKSIGEEVAQILKRLDELTPIGWELVVDGIAARKRPGNRGFSHELAIAQFTPDDLEACKAEGLDPKKVRTVAESKGLVEACMVAAPPEKASVSLKP